MFFIVSEKAFVMGQTQSGADSGATGITDHVQRHAFEARKIATLSYAAFIQSVEELNKMYV